MGLIERIQAWLMKNDTATSPDGICPNCWGRQEYNGKLLDVVRDHEIDVKNKDHFAQDAFIKQFAREHVDGIQLQNTDKGHYCPVCRYEETA